MKCQILFSGKNKKNNIILSSAENAQRVVKVKLTQPSRDDSKIPQAKSIELNTEMSYLRRTPRIRTLTSHHTCFKMETCPFLRLQTTCTW